MKQWLGCGSALWKSEKENTKQIYVCETTMTPDSKNVNLKDGQRKWQSLNAFPPKDD